MEERKRIAFKNSDLIWLAVISLTAFLMLVLTNSSYGMVWDEGFYWPTYVKVREWCWILVTSPGEALSREAIDLYWKEINELPPVTKFLGALSIGSDFGGNPLLSMRLVTMVLFGLTTGFLFLISRAIYPHLPHWQAALPPVLYLFHPRLFGHGHFATSETVFSFLVVLFILVLTVLPISLFRRILISYLVLALAIATKVNGLILGVASLCFVVYIFLQAVYGKKKNPDTENDLINGKQLCTLLGLYPVVIFLAWSIWPWMWYDTFDRLHEYWLFIRDHAHLGVWYLGESWPNREGNVPWHFPVVMTLAVTPLVTIGVIAAAFFVRVNQCLQDFRNKQKLPPQELILLLLLIVGPISAMIVTGAPKYDGIRLFIPVFAPLMLLAPAIWQLFPAEADHKSDRLPLFGVGLVFLILCIESIPYYNKAMSYYNVVVRVTSSDEPDFPFEHTYWMESLTPDIFEKMVILSGKDDEEIHVITRAVFPQVFEIQQQWGTIPSSIRWNEGGPYDFHLIHYRKGFWREVDWWLYLNRDPLVDDPITPETPRFLILDGTPPGQ